MIETPHTAVLKRMISRGQSEAVGNPLTTSRAVRLALTKAANDAVGLVLTVSSVGEYTNPLDTMLADLPDDLMLVGLSRDGARVGFIALDLELRAAVLETQMMGVLAPQAADNRPPTSADLAMCNPLLTAFLGALPDAVKDTDLVGWCDDLHHDERIADKRVAGLILEDTLYRVLQLDVQMTHADRQGTLLLVLPPVSPAPEQVDVAVDAPVHPDWNTHFPKTVAQAPATLTALLHQFALPLRTARQLEVGAVLPLTGCSVNSVRLLSATGKVAAQAKLGQSGGMRAVRIEAAPMPDLQALDPTQHDDALLPDAAPEMLLPEEQGDAVGDHPDGLPLSIDPDIGGLGGDLLAEDGAI